LKEEKEKVSKILEEFEKKQRIEKELKRQKYQEEEIIFKSKAAAS